METELWQAFEPWQWIAGGVVVAVCIIALAGRGVPAAR